MARLLARIGLANCLYSSGSDPSSVGTDAVEAIPCGVWCVGVQMEPTWPSFEPDRAGNDRGVHHGFRPRELADTADRRFRRSDVAVRACYGVHRQVSGGAGVEPVPERRTAPGSGGGRSRAQPRVQTGKRNVAANAVPLGMSSARTAYTLPLTMRVRRRISSPTP